MSDLEDGFLSTDAEEVPAEAAWAVYKKLPEFDGVCFKQFSKHLKDHLCIVKKKAQQSIWEEEAF